MSGTVTFEYSDLIQEVSDEKNTDQIIDRDFIPKPPRFYSAVDPAIKTYPYLARTCKNRSR
jgi:hypothetical protein